MYTVDETYAEIQQLPENNLVCDRTFHTHTGEIRVICWGEFATVHGRDERVWVVRSWANSQWNDTQFAATLDRAAVLVDSFEYGVN